MGQSSIPCVFLRGGSSKGCFLWEADLPSDPLERDAALLAMYGSPDARQIDGIGGGDPLTSKAIILSPSQDNQADIEYTFAQVGITEDKVYYGGNCGNMLAGVGPFAIDEGVVAAEGPTTTVRILNRNTGQRIDAEVEVEEGRAKVEGRAIVAGVPGTGSPIKLNFLGCEGAVTGTLLPTGHPVDEIDVDGVRVPVSLVDAATPFVFVEAKRIGAHGDESPEQIAADPGLLGRLEEVRQWAARAIGLCGPEEIAATRTPNVPRVAMISAPKSYVATNGLAVPGDSVSLLGRQMSMQRPHKTYAVTGAVCTAVAASIEGTVVCAIATPGGGQVIVGHPLGPMAVEVSVSDGRGGPHVERAALIRTARRIMDGRIYFNPRRSDE